MLRLHGRLFLLNIFHPNRYILSLLNKFEVALTWDYRTLLIPSLLPLTENEPDNMIALKVIAMILQQICIAHKQM